MFTFELTNDVLIAIYTPSWGVENIRAKLEEENFAIIKRTFHIEQEYARNDEDFDYDEEIAFIIGRVEGNYIKLDKDVFYIDHDVYFSKDIKFNINLFIASRNISIISKLDEVIKTDIYITTEPEDITPNHIPFQTYKQLVSTFPNDTELIKYTHARIESAIINFCDGLGKKNEQYEKYLNKRLSGTPHKDVIDSQLKLELFKQGYAELHNMLQNYECYSEPDWQKKILEIVCILFPKYVWAKREVFIGSDGRHKKKPDYILLDANGFIDVLEIKKPKKQRVMTPTKYRNNYIADREFSGVIVQIEKYLYCLKKGGDRLEDKLNGDLSSELPKGLKVKINNPQGLLLMGRSDQMTLDQLFDFEIIKRQYKNIVDIMTYDDLLNRIENIIKFFS